MNTDINKRINKAKICLIKAAQNYPPNEDIILAENENLWVSKKSENETSIEVQGNVILKLRPKPRLVIQIESNAKIFNENLNSKEILKVSRENFDMYCRVTRLNQHNFGTYNITLSSVDDRTHSEEKNELKYATFDIINFPMCLGKGVQGRNNPNFLYRSRLEIHDDEWNVTLDKIENYKDVQEKLTSNDGFGVTYVGRIEKSNKEPFHSKELARIINKIYYFVSFARGANSPIFHLKSYNDKDENVWQNWSLRSSARWSLTQNNWFCDQHSFDQLHELFPEWSKLFDDELWEKEIPKILYWYCYAGRNTEGAGTDGSLILAIAALELFSFDYLVRYASIRNKKKYESKHLSNNIYKMLEKLDVPDNLPEQLKNLHGYSINKNWQSGPKAIVELRNEIVHPDRESIPNSHVCYDALQLALWYIEMVILKLCNYKGVYSNRLNRIKWTGEVEQIPWIKKEK